MIVIAFDGSDGATAALEQAGELFVGQEATIVTVWQRFLDLMARTGGSIEAAAFDYGDLDRSAEQTAEQTAQTGAEAASAAGLDATGRAVVASSSVADAILDVAAELDASAVVIGTRGHTGVKSLLLGSVSHQLLQRASRPVVVVPSPKVASKRAEHRKSLQ